MQASDFPALDMVAVSQNPSFSSCRLNRSEICLSPFKPLWLYGLVVSWIFIVSVSFMVAIGLIRDWNNDKRCFSHLNNKEEELRNQDEFMGEKVRERNPPILRQHSLGLVFKCIKIPAIRKPQPRGESVRKMVENMERLSV